MKALTKVFSKPQWLNKTNRAKGVLAVVNQRMLVLPKQHYTEFQRSYKAALTDLPKLIRNELKVLAAAGSKAIWKVQSGANGRYQVLYAVLPISTMQSLPSGWHLIIPETWLLYRLLTKRTLYKVQANTPYWAWLAESNQLHLTPIQGLMSNQNFFLDALGENNAGITPALLTLPSNLQNQALPLKWWELAGCLVHISAKQTKQPIDHKKVGLYAALTVAAYMLITSVALTWQENRLHKRVQQLQVEASALFDQQQVLDEKADILQQYRALYQRFPSASIMLHTLSSQLADSAVLENIQQSGALLQIRGVAPSATDVLSKLSGQAVWSEVKFDRSIQQASNGESFTISLVYQPSAQQANALATEQSEASNEK